MKKIIAIIDIESLLIFIASLTFISGGIYRAYALNTKGVILSFFLSLILTIIILFLRIKYNNLRQYDKPKTVSSRLLLLTIPLNIAFLAYSFFILYSHSTNSAIISPWQIVPPSFFLFYGVSFLLLLANAVLAPKLSLLFAGFQFLLSFCVAVAVFKLGFGFDPFIHQATEDLISKNGVVDPKPLYYLGQYGLVVSLNKLFGLSVVWLDRLAVPLLSALGLPYLLWRTLDNWFGDKLRAAVTITAVTILPFSAFIVTTPQNLAYVFLLFAVLYGVKCRNNYELLTVFVFSLAALLTQPIAGIPAILFSCLLTIHHSDSNVYKRHLSFLIFLLVIVSLPFAFMYVAKTNQDPNSVIAASSELSEQALAGISLPALSWSGQENIILNFVYFFGVNRWLLIAMLAFTGIVLAYRYRKHCSVLSVYLIMALGLSFSYILSQHLSFSYLIDYERGNFADRILVIAIFFLIPFILLGLYGLVHRICQNNLFIKVSFSLLLALLATSGVYLAYPRFDNYFNSHIYSIGQSDIDAVRWIEEDSSGDYIALANQQVSAAALKEYGFKKYYEGDIFYYPIPTGGILYQYYLDMVYTKPEKISMLGAMNRVGVSESYFVLNRYWWASDKIREEAKLEADSWREFGNGEVSVFKYLYTSEE